jgi:hypothetical protein
MFGALIMREHLTFNSGSRDFIHVFVQQLILKFRISMPVPLPRRSARLGCRPRELPPRAPL